MLKVAYASAQGQLNVAVIGRKHCMYIFGTLTTWLHKHTVHVD